MGIETVKFRGRHNSVKAILALVGGALSVATLVGLPIASALEGETFFYMGALGLGAAIISLLGLIASIRATQERDVYLALPIAGMVVNGISLLAYFIIYIVGLV